MQIALRPLLRSNFLRRILGAAVGATLSLSLYTAYQWGSTALASVLTSPEEAERIERWEAIGRRARELMDEKTLPAAQGGSVQ